MGIVTQTTAAPPQTATDFGSQLQYSLTTVPDPLTVSPASGTVEPGDLIIVGSRIAPEPIETNEIAVHVPIGTEAWQLVLDYTGMKPEINLTGWTATPDPANERILFKPTSGHATLTPEQGISVQLNELRLNRQVGTAPVIIVVNWRTPGSTSWRTEEQTFSIGKFPAGFYLRDLKANDAYIENGDSVTLTWERSEGPTYHLLYENTEIKVDKYSTYTVQDIRRNTMFYLRSRIQQGTGHAERTISTYITVNKPDLEVGHLTIHGDTVAHGDITMTEPTKTLQTAKIQAVGGPGQLDSTVQFPNRVKIEGQLTLDSMSASGEVQIKQSGSLRVNGNLRGADASEVSFKTLRSSDDTLNVVGKLTVNGKQVLTNPPQ